MSLSADEVRRFLAEPSLAGAAADLELSDASLLGDLSRLRESVGDMARPVVELEKARRSVRGKLPEGWLLDSDSAQQATHAAVARRRARRIAASGLAAHDVTCSIGGEVAALADAGVDVLGTDLDFARVLMARHNVGGTGPGPAAPGRATFAVADALAPVSSGRAVIADPARRSGGRRIARPEDLIPPLPDLLDAWAGHELAVKCAPGLDYSDWDGEAAVTSVDGGVKEVCLYTPGLSGRGEAGGVVRRSAHLLRTRGEGTAAATAEGAAAMAESYDDTMPDDCAVADAGRYIIDPDGAVVRAGLVRHYAAAHGLWQLDERIAHLTGDAIPAGASGFEVIDRVPLKRVRSALAGLDCGSAEILVRGVDANPDVLRKQWKLKGSVPLAVVVTRIGSAGVAFVCRPRQWGYPSGA